ncbi:gastrula zinc finger protein XlCGF28.1-like [Silurus asotus]|uniref:Gastrula zinc finger protein XlCGF28.1-like n=1 Tax=Silurus asotus TaxID=30991 RepID=A0AAD4ZYM7_SILAS|nr:gastrula zinc finger protein XlCGF28.1-like [Silurus asotus]
MGNADASLAELNIFYARFEAAAKHASGTNSMHAERAGEVNTFTISEHDVRRAFKSEYQEGSRTRWHRSPPLFQPNCINYRPVALTLVVIKCFERLVRDFITASLPDTLDPLQFVYRQNRSTEDAIAHLLHTTMSHLDYRKGNYTKLLFVNYSSVFNTIIPSTLTSKLKVLGLSLPLCQWISNFLTDRPQAVRVGKHTSSTLTLSTEAPQGCVLSPLLYSLYTYECVATSNSTTIKFADDIVVVGPISNNDEMAYLQEFKNLERWCQENNLLLNVSKTKELIMDLSTKQGRSYQPLNINGTPVERVDSFRYLGVKITQGLSWSCQTNTLVKKAWQRLYHLRRLMDSKLPSQMLKTFYNCTIESVLTGSITSWSREQHHVGQCRTKARKIVKDLSHPNNGLFTLLHSGKRFRSLKANTRRMRRSFFPQAIRSLNQETPRI